jgi:hypothetical protein
MRNLWRDSGLTIVVLPSGEQGDRLYEVAKLWTELKMLAPAMWVRQELLDPIVDGPPKQTAVVLGNKLGGSTDEVNVDLFQQLARQPLSLVRLLVVRSAVPNAAFDEKQDALVNLLSQYLDWSMPATIGASEATESVTSFVKLNLITAPTEHTVTEGSRYVNHLFNANFLAATEDRATPTSGDAFVRYDSKTLKFAGFTMMHVASLGALWTGLPQGTHELVKPGVWMGDKVYISRVFLSAILTDGLARRASARVLESAGNANSGFVDLSIGLPIEGTVPIPDSGYEKSVAWMVDQSFAFDGEVLKYKAPTPSDESKARDLTVLGQISEFFRFCLDKMLRVPYFALIWLYRALVRTLNQIFQGGSKGSSLIAEPKERMDKRDQLVLEKLESVQETKAQADAALVSPVTPSHVRSTPELWNKIRRLVFGMLDGSNLEQFGLTKGDNGWPIFYKVSAVFNDPSQKLTVLNPESQDAEQMELDWNAVARVPEITGKFHAKTRTLELENQKTLEQLVSIRQEIDSKSLRISALKSRLDELQPKPEVHELEEEAL